MTYNGLFQNQIVKHLVCLGANGASTCQRVRPKVITLMKMEQTPYLIGIHCMAHRTNHVVHNLSSMLMVSKLENLFQLFLVPPNTILNCGNRRFEISLECEDEVDWHADTFGASWEKI